MTPDTTTTVDYVAKLSPFALVVLALVTNRLGVWYWGTDRKELIERHAREMAEIRADRDEYKALAYQLSGVAALANEAMRMALPQRAAR